MSRLPIVALFSLSFAVLLSSCTGGCVGGRAAEPKSHPGAAAPAPASPPLVPIRFRNVAAAAGLHYRWPSDGPRPRTIFQTMGYGCAFLDYDGDGNLDILLVGPHPALYRGDGKGQFTDVTQSAGLGALHGLFFGCAVGDYDNDGRPDIYISAYRGGVLLHNEQGKTFKDVTPKVGLRPQPWGTSCAWADLNGDGFLDLIVCNYVDYNKTSLQLCKQKGKLTACPPQNYPPLHTSVFQNIGGQRFTEATGKLLASPSSGNSLGVAVADSEGNGQQEIAIANDLMPGDLYRRPTKSTAFINIANSSGTATDGDGAQHAGMGIDWGDIDNDGKLDLFVTTFTAETKCLYHNLGNGVFAEEAHLAGVGSAAWNYVAFGCKFLDADNDGWLDLIIANGHTSDNVHDIIPEYSYREPLQFFRNTERSPQIFADASKSFMAEPLAPIVGRGLAIGDYDNDGKVDVLVVDGEGAPLLLHNETPSAGNGIGLSLIGTGKSNRDGYGARVTVTPEGGKPRVTECRTDGSYLSSSDPRIHIGLGAASRADVMVRWPDGQEQTWHGLSAGRDYRLKEGDTSAR